MTLLLEAQIAFDSGDETSGANLLRKAMALGKEHGYVNGVFLGELHDGKALCKSTRT